MFQSSTPVVVSADADHPEEPDTLERVMMGAFDQGVERLLGAPEALQDGQPCTETRKRARISFVINRPLLLRQGLVKLTLPNFAYDMLVRTSQSRIVVDRSDNFLFTLAVVNFVTGEVHAASRRRGETASKLVPLATSKPNDDPGIVKSGTVIRVLAAGLQNIETMASTPPKLPPFVYDVTRKTNLGVAGAGAGTPQQDPPEGSPAG